MFFVFLFWEGAIKSKALLLCSPPYNLAYPSLVTLRPLKIEKFLTFFEKMWPVSM